MLYRRVNVRSRGTERSTRASRDCCRSENRWRFPFNDRLHFARTNRFRLGFLRLQFFQVG